MKSTWQHVLFLLTKITDFVSALPSECKREIPLGVVNNGGKTIDEYCWPYVMYSCVVYFTRTHAKKSLYSWSPLLHTGYAHQLFKTRVAHHCKTIKLKTAYNCTEILLGGSDFEKSNCALQHCCFRVVGEFSLVQRALY